MTVKFSNNFQTLAWLNFYNLVTNLQSLELNFLGLN